MNKHMKPANPIVAEELLERHGDHCPYCDRMMDVRVLSLQPTRDHVRSKKRFKHEKDNRIFIVCSECNYMKGDQTLAEFVASLIAKTAVFTEAIKLNNERVIRLNMFMKMGLK